MRLIDADAMNSHFEIGILPLRLLLTFLSDPFSSFISPLPALLSSSLHLPPSSLSYLHREAMGSPNEEKQAYPPLVLLITSAGVSV
jgi:hypothetical protein